MYIYNTKYNVAYHPIPKCASSSLNKWICHDKILDTYVEGYFHFTVVRNPYTRILSSYSALFPIKNMCVPLDTFENFVHALPESGLLFDPHVIPQTNFLKLPNHYIGDLRHLDFIAKFEQLEKDINYVAQQCSIPDYFEMRHLNKSKLSAAPKHTTETKKIVYNLYKIDFDTFSYKQ